jgi:hypothetical protein
MWLVLGPRQKSQSVAFEGHVSAREPEVVHREGSGGARGGFPAPAQGIAVAEILAPEIGVLILVVGELTYRL